MTATTSPDTARLRRVQLGARATLTLGIGASLAANVLAAEPTLVGRLIAAWSPIALLLTVELLSRVPASGGWLSRLRIASAATIAAIAAWVSYWHIVEVAQAFGEASIAAHLLPLSVDGLVVVASVCLVEISHRTTPVDTGEPAATEPRTPAAPVRKSTSRPKPDARRNGSARASVGDQVRRLAAEHPDWTQAELAEAAGCSIRTVRRHLTSATTQSAPKTTPRESQPANDGTDARKEVAA